MIKKELLWIISVSILIQSVKAATIKFEAFPNELKTNLTDAVSMRCDVVGPYTGNSSNSATISISVTRGNGDEVASVTLHDGSMTYVDVGNLEAKGSVDSGYLELSWKNPSKMQLGQYTCNVTAWSPSGQYSGLVTVLQMTSISPSMEDVITHFNTKLKDYQQEMAIQTERVEHLTFDNMRHEQTINNMNTTIESLKACTSPKMAFTATFKDVGKITKSGTVTFDKVLLNEGGAYNGTTGEFTCSTPGIYSFTAFVENAPTQPGSPNYMICIQLQVNGGRAITSLYANDEDADYGSSSIGATIALYRDDVVRVITFCPSTFYQTLRSYEQANIFTGHLIRGDQCDADGAGISSSSP